MDYADQGFEKHRLAGLQDSVYSIALTLLVLELKLPGLPEHIGNAALWAALVELWPKVLTWLLSFWVLAMFWVSDVRAHRSLSTVDRVTLRLGLGRLALVSLPPFSTALMGEHGDLVTPSALYALHILGLALMPLLRLLLVERPGSAASSPRPDPISADSRLAVITTFACALVALGLAFMVPGYNMLALLPIALLPLTRRLIRSGPGPGAAA
ncbi:TMEM175 family protein [Quisquiliibacterium transsilvanicum]|uniref:Putative membrane protein n=1 Tax=Quisquiliibacterium transsilvanicum TaxID=1549638 RepID=A0A7W8HHR3_9BURK|nr:TMEM175 family protein [Quisquiliibacterium transsilvanicum]MBB5272269.1 putative membrane protein [Quisquiliibacterium transsilvanicum]